jgi:type II secretory pathway component PulL
MRKASFLLWRVLSVATFLTFLAHQAGSAWAQEHVFDETRQACGPEAIRLCREFIPDVPKITACMEAKYAQINEECRLAMIRERYVRRSLARSGKPHAPPGN